MYVANLLQATQRETQTNPRKLDTDFRFAMALIEENGNATAAAKKVFRFGIKGGRRENSDNVAAAMGWRMLRNAKVQEHLDRFVRTSEASVYRALETLAEIMNSSDPEVARKAAVDLLRYHGKYDRRSPSPLHNEDVNLVVPSRLIES